MHDLNGTVIPRGRIIRERVFDCLAGPLPVWLPTNLLDGTGSFVGPSVSTGYYQLAGSPTLALRTVGYDALRQELLSFTVEGVCFNSAVGIVPGISLKDDAGTCGVAFFNPIGAAKCVLRLLGPTGHTDIQTEYGWGGAELTRHRNLTVVIGTRDKSVWLMEDDQVMHYGVYPSLVLGTVRGVLDASVTGPREMRVCQVRYRMESN
jgi:hypothetical protein